MLFRIPPNPDIIRDAHTDRGKEIILYVLQLESFKLYVGQSIDPKGRIKAHFKGKGSAWTKLHPPTQTIKEWDTGFTDWKEAEREENRITLTLMEKFGWQNVRGGFWSNTAEYETMKGLEHHTILLESLGFIFREKQIFKASSGV